jgi:hypothetical protein
VRIFTRAGQNRVLLVMATGSGIWRLWKSRGVQTALFLIDRNILVDQMLINDFKPFAGPMQSALAEPAIAGTVKHTAPPRPARRLDSPSRDVQPCRQFGFRAYLLSQLGQDAVSFGFRSSFILPPLKL